MLKSRACILSILAAYRVSRPWPLKPFGAQSISSPQSRNPDTVIPTPRRDLPIDPVVGRLKPATQRLCRLPREFLFSTGGCRNYARARPRVLPYAGSRFFCRQCPIGLSAPTLAQTNKMDAGAPTASAQPNTNSTAASNSNDSTDNSAGATPGPKSTGGSQPVTPIPQKKQ